MNGTPDYQAGEERGRREGEVFARLDALGTEVRDLKVDVSDLRNSMESKFLTLTNSLDQFKIGIGSKVESHGMRISKMEERIAVVTRIGGWILAPAFGAIVLALLGMILIKR